MSTQDLAFRGRIWSSLVAVLLQSVAVCCSALQCCSVLTLYLAFRGGIFLYVFVCVCVLFVECFRERLLQCVAVCCSALQCVAVCCSVLPWLQGVAVCCSVLQRVCVIYGVLPGI